MVSREDNRSYKPPFGTPSGVAKTGRRDGRDTQEALARLHSGGSLNRSHACTAGGRGSSAATYVARFLLGPNAVSVARGC